MQITTWKEENRNFEGDLAIGKYGEAETQKLLWSFPNVKQVDDISDTEYGKAHDVDIEVEYKNGMRTKFEVKTDMKACKTKNIIFEERSKKGVGCFVKTKAEYIAYLLAEEVDGVKYKKSLYIINAEEFRSFISEMKAEKAKAKEYGIRYTWMGEKARGYIVPIEAARKAGLFVCEFEFNEQPSAKAAA